MSQARRRRVVRRRFRWWSGGSGGSTVTVTLSVPVKLPGLVTVKVKSNVVASVTLGAVKLAVALSAPVNAMPAGPVHA